MQNLDCILYSVVCLGRLPTIKRADFFRTYIVNVKLHFTWNVKSLKKMGFFCFMIACYLGTLNSAVIFSDKGF